MCYITRNPILNTQILLERIFPLKVQKSDCNFKGMKGTDLSVALLNVLKFVMVNFFMAYSEATSLNDGGSVKQGYATQTVVGR